MPESQRWRLWFGTILLAGAGWSTLWACDGTTVDTGEAAPELTWVGRDAADAVVTMGATFHGYDYWRLEPALIMRGHGDVTGDGVEDMLVPNVNTDWFGNADRSNSAVVVLPGPISGHLDVASGIPVMLSTSTSRFSNSTTWNGDTNGDGVNDILVSATDNPASYGSSSWERPVYLFQGPIVSPVYVDDAALLIEVEPEGRSKAYTWDNLRRVIDSGKDVNGDGFDDILVGHRPDGDNSNPGAVYVFFGGAALGGHVTTTEADLEVVGGDDTDNVGFYGALLSGDITGDGRPDLVITADRAGEDAPTSFGSWTEQMVAILEGGSEGTQSAAERVGSITGIAPTYSDIIGLASGNVDGDGLADLFVSTPQWEDGDAIYLFHGPIEGEQDAATSAAWTFADEDVFERNYLNLMAGISLDVAGDIDADGTPDLLISVEDWTGMTYLYGYTTWGQGMGFACTRYDAGCQDVNTADIRFQGNWDSFGEHMVHLGDVSGDGFDDFMVTADRDDGLIEYTGMGEAFIYYGGPDVVERLMGEPP